MPTLQITLRLITPAYAGAASPGQTDGLRPPTLKALLRFWWRALHPGLGPADLFRQEEALFGSTEVGQGLRLAPDGPWPRWHYDRPGTVEPKPLHTYLAYGAVSWDSASGATVLRTPRIHAGEQVRLRLSWGAGAPASLRADLGQVLWAVSAFGCLGSRSRRGWGSVQVSCPGGFGPGLPDLAEAGNLRDLRQRLRAGLHTLLGPRSAIGLPPDVTAPLHTAFSPSARLLVGQAVCDTAEEAHEQLYDSLNNLRRFLGAEWGHAPGDVGVDHRLRSGWLSTPPVSGARAPHGVAFGLPQNAQFSPPPGLPRSAGKKVLLGVGPRLDGRRASPLFLKVLPCGDRYVPVFLWLPALFLPSGQAIHVAPQGQPVTSLAYPGDGALKLLFGSLTGTKYSYPRWDPLVGDRRTPFQEVHW